jgi:hypothetical protein
MREQAQFEPVPALTKILTRYVFACLVLAFAPVRAAERNQCAPCHEKQTAAFARSGMGRSVSVVETPRARFAHKFSNANLRVELRNNVMSHSVEQHGFTAEYPIALAIGSGKVGQSYAVRVGGLLFESPISWFSQSRRWGISPGYEFDKSPDFDRRITAECLGCHTGMASLDDAPRPIQCGQCHPASSGHFVNPAKLSAPQRDAVCEGCHLQGEARILNPGSSWGDRQPSFTTYVSSGLAPALKVVSQVEQLALSECVRKGNGKLWCGTCHNPHGPKTELRQVCLSCHTGTLSALHTPKQRDCAACHMPRRATPEIAHTVYTDHRIRRNPAAELVAGNLASLKPWREPPSEYRDRNLGLAYIYAGQREASAEWIQKGFAILMESPARDADALSALGLVLLQKQRPKEAAKLFAEAAQLQPARADHAHNAGVSLMSAGDVKGAIASLERATTLDPLLQESWLFLARIYKETGKSELREQTLKAFLRHMPQSIAVRAALRN